MTRTSRCPFSLWRFVAEWPGGKSSSWACTWASTRALEDDRIAVLSKSFQAVIPTSELNTSTDLPRDWGTKGVGAELLPQGEARSAALEAAEEAASMCWLRLGQTWEGQSDEEPALLAALGWKAVDIDTPDQGSCTLRPNVQSLKGGGWERRKGILGRDPGAGSSIGLRP